MSVGVVRHSVSRIVDRTNQFGMRQRLFSDDKKSGLRALLCQQFENARRIVTIGTIVDGEPDFLSGGGETAGKLHQPLGAGHEKVVGQQEIGHQPQRDRDGRSAEANADGGRLSSSVEGE